MVIKKLSYVNKVWELNLTTSYMQYNISDSQVLVWCFALIILTMASLDILFLYSTTQKMKFSIKDFFSKCDQIRSFLRIGHICWRNP